MFLCMECKMHQCTRIAFDFASKGKRGAWHNRWSGRRSHSSSALNTRGALAHQYKQEEARPSLHNFSVV